MEMKQLIEFAKEFIQKHPQHKGEVIDLVQLCKDEIEEGGSISHEINLCIGSIQDLLTNQE